MPNLYQIIIAEDEDVLAAMLVRLIVRLYPTAVVRTFGDGRVALAAYDRDGADLLLVNHAMPRMDGPTLIRTLRARSDSVPIIGMSGDPDNRQEYVSAGAQAFVSGAGMISELPGLLRRFLPPAAERASEVGGA